MTRHLLFSLLISLPMFSSCLFGFKKATDTPVRAVEATFYDQFPTWSIRHSQKLAQEIAQEIAGVTLNEKEEAILIDCLAGGHVVYLSLTLPKEVIFLLGGADKLATRLLSLTETGSQFARRELARFFMMFKL